jgi:hypothetical protein
MANNEIEKTAVHGIATISTANSNLDGTGTLGTIISGTANGVKIQRVYIKAIGDVTQGMVRLFLYDGAGGGTVLIKEIPVPAVDQSSVNPAFVRVVRFPEGLTLSNGFSLKASTQNAESFNIIAEGYSWNYPGTTSKIEFTGADAMVNVSTANSNLDGTGTLATLITGTNNGTLIKSITVKAIGSSTIGMVRLFISTGGGTPTLFMEIPIPTSAQYNTVPAFTKKINFRGLGFLLGNGYIIKATTQVAQTFNLSADAVSWDYI